MDAQEISINFQQGLDLKSDPNQIPIGKFQALNNTVFDKVGRLTKRSGFPQITALPDSTSTFVTTFSDNLTAIGKDIKAYAQGPNSWVTVQGFEPVQVGVTPLVRNNNNQTQCDVAVSSSSLACVVYTDSTSSASTNINTYRYALYDLNTSQAFIKSTQIQTTFGVNLFAPRVFNLYPYFILVFDATSGSTSHLQYQAISQVSLQTIGSATDITTSYAPQTPGAFDGVVAANTLYLSWNGAANSGIKSRYLDSYLNQNLETVIASSTQVQAMSVCADTSQTAPIIWTTFAVGSVTGSQRVGTVATNGFSTYFSAKTIASNTAITNIATYAINNQLTAYYEVQNTYAFGSMSATNYINKRTVSVASVTVSQEVTFLRSVGLASKAFLIGSQGYFLSTYGSSLQPTYFLVNGSASVLSRIAYSNGGGYLTTGLPQGSVIGHTVYIGYLFKDLVQSVNKGTAVGSMTPTAQIYAQTGINLSNFTFTSDGLTTTETAGNLFFSGGYLSQYDGTQLVENNFHLYPDDIFISTSAPVGSGSPQTYGTYYYKATYEWQDNAGNLYRSADSIAYPIVVSSTNFTNSVFIPTLRLTSKTLNPVKIVLYRWSALQQNYYQVTSITHPVLNSTVTDSVTILDSATDAQILGNNLLYTTGGVVSDDGPHPMTSITQFDTRLWGIDSEDQNLDRFSKELIESAPVEMSDLFTYFVAPNTGAQGSTGPMKCQFPMDDKLILFKDNAIYYINGAGPDNTGAQNQYSRPIFITGTVGCANPNSIVLIPQGLMFQSDKGIWLLGRDLSTNYIGKDVETYNDFPVTSAVVVPGTNQVRFTLNNNTALMYDYFVGQWSTFSNLAALSSCLYNNKHTYIDKFGRVYQESPGTYLDGSRPTLMSFTTGWLSLGTIQSYMRAYSVYLLGEYYTPHRLTMGIAYDYDPNVVQLATLIPFNYSAPWGDDSTWGQITQWGGETKREQWQVNIKNQQCQAMQISLNEYYDPSVGASPGAGLTISGVKLICGMKGSYPKNLGIRQKRG
jgi:hypothetical protein